MFFCQAASKVLVLIPSFFRSKSPVDVDGTEIFETGDCALFLHARCNGNLKHALTFSRVAQVYLQSLCCRTGSSVNAVSVRGLCYRMLSVCWLVLFGFKGAVQHCDQSA